MASTVVRLPILTVLRLATLEFKNSPDISGSDSLNSGASLHQERFAKWSKRNSDRSLKSLADAWIRKHYYENDCDRKDWTGKTAQIDCRVLHTAYCLLL
jgi:hypothetical protein